MHEVKMDAVIYRQNEDKKLAVNLKFCFSSGYRSLVQVGCVMNYTELG
jgi:hypothetical protein